MKIKSDLDLIKKAYKGKIILPEISEYLKKHYDKNNSGLELLRAEIYKFKLEKTIKKIKDLNTDPKFIAMRLNYEEKGKKMPLISYMVESNGEDIDAVEYYETMRSELQNFINEFLPTQFLGLNKIELIIDDLIENKSVQKSNPQNIQSYIKWTDKTQVNFFEVFKGLREAGLVKFKRNEKDVFEFLREVFGIEEFNVEGASKSSKKRVGDDNIYYIIADDLDRWRKKRKKTN